MLQAPEPEPCLSPRWPLSCIEPEMVLTASRSLAIQSFVCWAYYPKNTQLDIWVVLTSLAECQEHPSGKKWSRFKTYTKDKKQPKRELRRAPKSPNTRKFTWPLTKRPQLAAISTSSSKVSLCETTQHRWLPRCTPSSTGLSPGRHEMACQPSHAMLASQYSYWVALFPDFLFPQASHTGFLPSIVNAPSYTDPPTDRHIHE